MRSLIRKILFNKKYVNLLRNVIMCAPKAAFTRATFLQRDSKIFLCVKISVAERLHTRGKTRLPRSRLGRIAAV